MTLDEDLMEIEPIFRGTDGTFQFTEYSFQEALTAKEFVDEDVDISPYFNNKAWENIITFYSSFLEDSTRLVDSLLSKKSEEQHVGLTIEFGWNGKMFKGDRAIEHSGVFEYYTYLAAKCIRVSNYVSEDIVAKCLDKLLQISPEENIGDREPIQSHEPFVAIAKYIQRNDLSNLKQRLIRELTGIIFDRTYTCLAREHIAMALAVISPTQVAKDMCIYLDNKENMIDTRAMAAVTIGLTRSLIGINSLNNFLNEPDHDRHWVATEALRKIGTQEAINSLRNALRNSSIERYSTCSTLEELGWVPSNRQESNDYLTGRGIDIDLIPFPSYRAALLDNFTFITFIGNLLVNQGRFDIATPILKTATRMNPSFFEAHYNLARSLMHQKKYEEAEKCYRKALETGDCADIWVDYGLLYANQERFSEAVAVLNKGISKYPKKAGLYHNKSVALIGSGKISEARCALEEALKIEPNRPNSKGLLEYIDDIFNESYTYSEEVRGMKPAVIEYLRLAEINNSVNNRRQTIFYLEQALELDPNNSVVLNNTGIVKKELGEKEQAEQYFKRAIQHNSNFERAYGNLAELYLEMGKKDKAEEVLSKLRRINKNERS